MIQYLTCGVQVRMMMDAKMMRIHGDHRNNLLALLYNLGIRGGRLHARRIR